jgi:hypothetical protein
MSFSAEAVSCVLNEDDDITIGTHMRVSCPRISYAYIDWTSEMTQSLLRLD